MKKQLFFLLFSFLYFVTTSTGFAEEVHPSQEILGSSLPEKQIRWLWLHRKAFMQACAMTDCAQTEPVKSLWPQLNQVLTQTTDVQLQFKSEKSNPDFFSSNLGETHRIAITGREAGSPIYFNSDLLQDLSLENMVAIIFHELTHHLGVADDAKRLPDQVGALLAKSFMDNLLYAPFSGPDNFHLASAVFQFPVPKDSLQEKFFYQDFAFLTDGHLLFDTDLAKFLLTPACDQPGFSLAGQVTQTPHWRDLGADHDKRQVRLSMILVNACYKKDSLGQLSDYHYARRGYRFDLDLDSKGQILNSSQEALADAIQADIDYASTLELISVNYSKPQVTGGDDLQIKMQVKSYTDLQPQTCNFGISNQGAPLQGGGFPVAKETASCQVKVIGEDLWEISTSLKISSDMANGHYYPRIIKVVGTGKPNTALLMLPEKNGFEVINQNRTTAFSVQSIEINHELTPISQFGGQAVTNSYTYQSGQQIEIRIHTNSSSKVYIKGISTYTMSAVNNKLQAVQNSGSITDFTGFNMTQKTTDDGPQLKTIVLTFTVPERWQNYPLLGISLQQIYIENEAFQQINWNASGAWDYLFIDKRLSQANP